MIYNLCHQRRINFYLKISIYSSYYMPYDETGKWDIVPYNSPVFPIHAALLYTSKVLFISGSGNCVPRFNNNLFTSALWDYQDNTFKVFQTPSDIFCSGHSFLPDGKLVVAGGTLQYDPFKGLRDTYLFDPAQEEWRRVQQMTDGRWYPTLVTLGNGRVLAISGTSTTPDRVNRMTERYSKSRGWESLGDGPVWPLYPYLFLLADGRIFYSGGHFSNRNEPIPGWLDLKILLLLCLHYLQILILILVTNVLACYYHLHKTKK